MNFVGWYLVGCSVDERKCLLMVHTIAVDVFFAFWCLSCAWIGRGYR